MVNTLLGVHEQFEKQGYTTFLGITFDSLANQQQLISTMLENRVGGILLCPVSFSSTETVERINKLGIPIVVAIRELPNLMCDYIGLDYISGAYMGVSHLINKGHKRIAFIGGIAQSTTWTERFEGYVKAHHDANLSIDHKLILNGEPTREGGMKLVEQIMQQENPPTAIFCFSDLVAFGVIMGLRKMGYTPGKNVEIVGFDNVPETEISYPPLTTVSSFAKLTGMKAANLLHERIRNPEREKQRIIIEPELVIRESS